VFEDGGRLRRSWDSAVVTLHDKVPVPIGDTAQDKALQPFSRTDDLAFGEIRSCGNCVSPRVSHKLDSTGELYARTALLR